MIVKRLNNLFAYHKERGALKFKISCSCLQATKLLIIYLSILREQFDLGTHSDD